MKPIVYFGFKVIPFFSLIESDLDNFVFDNDDSLICNSKKGYIISVFCDHVALANKCRDKMENFLFTWIDESVQNHFSKKKFKKLLKDELKKKIYRDLDELVDVIDKKKTNDEYKDDEKYLGIIEGLVKVVQIDENGAVVDSFWNKYNSLWNEYKYRHDLIWKLVFRTIAASVVVSIIPYTKKTIVRDLNPVIVGSLLFIPILILVYALYSIRREIKLLSEIKKKFREIQKDYLKIDQGESGFEQRILIAFTFIIALAVLNFFVGILHEKFFDLVDYHKLWIYWLYILYVFGVFVGIIPLLFLSKKNWPLVLVTLALVIVGGLFIWLQFQDLIQNYAFKVTYYDEEKYREEVEIPIKSAETYETDVLQITLTNERLILVPRKCFPELEGYSKNQFSDITVDKKNKILKWNHTNRSFSFEKIQKKVLFCK